MTARSRTLTYPDHPSIAMVDGCRLRYAVKGSGPPVLFIQGVGVHGDGWLPQIDAMADRYRCLRFDNRGIGASELGPEQLTVARMAADAAALLERQGWDAAHLVGHSLGGLIGLRLALTWPERVRSLALLCTFARGRDAGANRRMAWLGLRSRIGTRRMRRHAFLEMVAPRRWLVGRDRDALAADLAKAVGHDLAAQPPVASRQLAALRGEDACPDLGRLAGIPTLVLSADEDPIAPPLIGARLARGIPGARYVQLPEASHGVPFTDPDRVTRLLLEHLARARD